MPNYYEISPTHDTLVLKNGKGLAGFAVRYVGRRRVEARAQPVAMQGAESEWLRVEQSAVKPMAPNQTQTFQVGVNVPKGTPPGRYGLRLDVVSVDNTDEEYDRGPVVAFEVAETKPEPEPPGFPWWLVVVIALILTPMLILGIGWGLFSGWLVSFVFVLVLVLSLAAGTWWAGLPRWEAAGTALVVALAAAVGLGWWAVLPWWVTTGVVLVLALVIGVGIWRVLSARGV